MAANSFFNSPHYYSHTPLAPHGERPVLRAVHSFDKLRTNGTEGVRVRGGLFDCPCKNLAARGVKDGGQIACYCKVHDGLDFPQPPTMLTLGGAVCRNGRSKANGARQSAERVVFFGFNIL